MNIEKLELTTYKNYKVLCEVLDEPFKKSGNSRDSQLKEWSRYFNFEKQGHKIIVAEIYDTVKSKEDGRGKSQGSLQALKSHNESIQTFPTGLLDNVFGCYKLLELAKKHNITILELVKLQHELNTAFAVKTQTALVDLHLFTSYTSQLMMENEELLLDFDEEVICCLYANLYRSTKNKLLKVKGLEQIKMIVDADGMQYVATDEQLEFIAEYEQCIVDRYNNRNENKLKTFNDIYSWNFPSEIRMKLQNAKKTMVSSNFEDNFGIAYVYDHSALVYNKSIDNIIQDLGLTVDDTLDAQVKELFQELLQQVHKLYYNSQVNRINKKFPPRTRGFGKSPTERKKKQALTLLRYSLARDLTDEERKQLKLILK